MTLPAWPGSLPDVVLTDGYGTEGVDPNQSSGMEDGHPYIRRKALNIWTPVTIQIFLEDTTQVQALKNFWRNTINCGASRFTMPIYTFEGSYVSKTCSWSGPGPTFKSFDGKNSPVASFKILVLDF